MKKECKPFGYWTKERCKEEALKYCGRLEFQKLSSSAYNASKNHGWLDEVCSHMISKYYSKGYWNNKELCQKEALKYNKRTDFKSKSSSAYFAALENKWLDEISLHMVRIAHNFKWTKEKCQEEALKYNKRTDFNTFSHSAYVTACTNKWLIEICQHMKILSIPHEYWTFERCNEEALKYKNRGEFKKLSKGAYLVSSENKWIDEICIHMNNNWTLERCKEEALKYDKRNDFKNSAASAYNSSLRNGWIDEICKHMNQGNNPKGYWNNKEICYNEALKYTRKVDLKNGSRQAYNSLCKNNWLDDACLHMLEIERPDGYWTLERCKEEALKYTTKTEFKNFSVSAYSISVQKKWISEICQHMTAIGNRYNKCVYVYEFNDNHAYIGITYDIKRRTHDRENCKTDAVTKYINISGLIPILKILTKYIPVDEAVILEGEYVEKYKNDGWIILNRVKTGSIGSVKKWTFEKCKEIALKFNNKRDLKKEFNGAYQVMCENKWLNELCLHMIELQKPKGFWNYENCKNEFIKYNCIKDVKNNASTAYCVAVKNKWIGDFISHMPKICKPKGFWTIEKCIEVAIICRNISEFIKKYRSAYVIANKNNWLNEIYLKANL